MLKFQNIIVQDNESAECKVMKIKLFAHIMPFQVLSPIT